MLTSLRILFVCIFASMLTVVLWAGSQVSLFAIPREVVGHPWFIATLVDVYWGFLIFYCWVFYLETTVAGRAIWLVAILGLGNIATSAYVLIRLFRLPANADSRQILLRPQTA